MLDPHLVIRDPDSGEIDHVYLEALIDLFRESPEAAEILNTDPDCGSWAGLFLDLYLGHIGATVAEIQASDVREVVLDLFPRKVSVGAEAAPEIVRELRAFWAFLGREYSLPQATEIQTLLDEKAEAQLREGLADVGHFGLAKSFFMLGQEAGYDMSTEEGMQAYLAAFNSSPLAGLPLGSFGSGRTSTKDSRKKRKAQRQAKKKNRGR